jgi:hypothetical protein
MNHFLNHEDHKGHEVRCIFLLMFVLFVFFVANETLAPSRLCVSLS